MDVKTLSVVIANQGFPIALSILLIFRIDSHRQIYAGDSITKSSPLFFFLCLTYYFGDIIINKLHHDCQYQSIRPHLFLQI